MAFLEILRRRSGGKPVGFKLCIGHRREFMCIVKAMLETGVVPDFIVVDGKEGGTGAAPLEFANHVGMPLVEGLSFVHNTLRGAGLRDRVRIGAAGKLVTPSTSRGPRAGGGLGEHGARLHVRDRLHPGPGLPHQPLPGRASPRRTPCASGRSTCPTRRSGWRTSTATPAALADMAGAAGLDDPRLFLPHHFMQRDTSGEMLTGEQVWPYLPEGFLIAGEKDRHGYLDRWTRARPDSFSPVTPGLTESSRLAS
jgi:hypothetical protein